MLIINRIRVKNKNNKLKKFEIKSLILFLLYIKNKKYLNIQIIIYEILNLG